MPTSKRKVFPLTAAYLEYLHDEGIALTFGARSEPVSTYDCRDLNLLFSAAQQPFQAVFDIECYPTIAEKASCLFFSLLTNHIFNNGNKRTAVLALDQFLYANGHELAWANPHVKRFAESIASYRERGEKTDAVRREIVQTLDMFLVPFRDIGAKTRAQLNTIKREIRNHPLNRPDALPRQAIRLGISSGRSVRD